MHVRGIMHGTGYRYIRCTAIVLFALLPAVSTTTASDLQSHAMLGMLCSYLSAMCPYYYAACMLHMLGALVSGTLR